MQWLTGIPLARWIGLQSPRKQNLIAKTNQPLQENARTQLSTNGGNYAAKR